MPDDVPTALIKAGCGLTLLVWVVLPILGITALIVFAQLQSC